MRSEAPVSKQEKKGGFSLFRRALELVYPPSCAFCGRCLPLGSPAAGVCPQCAGQLPRTDFSAAAQEGDCFSRCLSPLFYRDAVVDSIRQYKFSGQSCFHLAYGPLLRDCLQAHLSSPPDLITWAPLSRWRRFSRGYDQAQLLAQEAAALYGTQPVRLLDKVRHTRPQSSLPSSARKENARGAYHLSPKAPSVLGLEILLVDDVITTGSTLSACAGVLLAAGARDVVCLTLARGLRDPLR